MFCSTLVYATKVTPSECQQHWPGYGGRDLFTRLQHYRCANMLVLRKGCSYQTDREPLPTSHLHSKQVRKKTKNCSRHSSAT